MNENKDLSKPSSPAEYGRILFSGFVMGSAEIVPGVSGGTMAFVLGIYETLINAIKSVNLEAIDLLRKVDLKGLFDHIPFRFLIPLGIGMLVAIFTLSSFLDSALEHQPTFLFAFFGGLIVASIIAVGAKVEWSAGAIAALVIAAIFAFILTGFAEAEDANHSAPVLFFSGAIAICAMILPGISGSFILLILGQYEHIVGAVSDFDIVTLGSVGLGAVAGIIIFSRVLSWLLKRYPHVTVATMVGFMIGAMREIYEQAADGVPIANASGSLDIGQILLVVALFAVGFLAVTLLDHMQEGKNPVMTRVRRLQSINAT